MLEELKEVFLKGDEITILPSGFSSKIKSIDTFNGPISEAFSLCLYV